MRPVVPSLRGIATVTTTSSPVRLAASRKDPAWIHNVEKDGQVDIEVGNERFDATASIVDDEAERQRLWDDHVRALPWFADYPAQTGRLIPMVRLRARPSSRDRPRTSGLGHRNFITIWLWSDVREPARRRLRRPRPHPPRHPGASRGRGRRSWNSRHRSTSPQPRHLEAPPRARPAGFDLAQSQGHGPAQPPGGGSSGRRPSGSSDIASTEESHERLDALLAALQVDHRERKP